MNARSPARQTILWTALASLAACGSGAAIDGSLADPGAATHVWVEGMSERAEIEGGSFHLPRLRGDTLDLRFADGDREVAWMRLVDLPRGGRVQLHDVWFDADLAFPGAVDLDGSHIIHVHGLRMGPAQRVAGRVDERGTLLARESDRALVVRPDDDRMPDLRVVVTPGTRVRGEDGDPVELTVLGFGDPVRISGTGENGYLIAAEITVPREVTAGSEREEEVPPSAVESPGPAPAAPPPPAAAPPPPAPPGPPADAGPADRGPPGRGGDPPGRGRGRGGG